MKNDNMQITAIDFGTSKIVTMIALPGYKNRLEILGSGTVPYDGFSEGNWNTPRQMDRRLHDSIAAAEKQADCKVTEAYIGVPGEYIHVLTREVDMELAGGAYNSSTIDELYDIAADELGLAEYDGVMVLHRTLASLTLDGKRRTMEMQGFAHTITAKVSFVLADMFFIEDVSELMAHQNIAILGFLSSSLGQGLLQLSMDNRDRGATLIDCGYLNTEVNVFEGDAIIYHAILPQGGGHLTADIAMGLNIPMKMAESIKRRYAFTPDAFDSNSVFEVADADDGIVTFEREEVEGIVEKNIGDLAEMLRLTIDNDVDPLLSAKSTIGLTGGGLTLMSGAAEYLSGLVNRNIRVLQTKSTKLHSPVFSSLQGLMDLVINQIEEQQEETQALRGIFGKKR